MKQTIIFPCLYYSVLMAATTMLNNLSIVIHKINPQQIYILLICSKRVKFTKNIWDRNVNSHNQKHYMKSVKLQQRIQKIKVMRMFLPLLKLQSMVYLNIFIQLFQGKNLLTVKLLEKFVILFMKHHLMKRNVQTETLYITNALPWWVRKLWQK